jgi:hypothetical protein
MLDDRDGFASFEAPTQEELAQRNQDTRDSIRGKNNYQPGSHYQPGEEPYYPTYSEIIQNVW